MGVQLELTDRQGRREVGIDKEQFWIGTLRSGCDVELDVPGCFGRLLEVHRQSDGRLQLRAEPGLPFPVRSVSGNVGARFETFLDGDVLNVGPALVRMRALASHDEVRGEEIDPASLSSVEPGSPVGSWYDTFMGVADTLEGLTSPERMIQTALDGVLAATAAERVFLELDPEFQLADGTRKFYATKEGERAPFRVSRSLVEQVQQTRRVVHVPLAAADPIASRFQSVRAQGISASIALPLRALGKELGVLYADCVREGAVLSPTDLQRVAFVTRLLASALGNRDLVSTLVRTTPPPEAAVHPALQTRSAACAEMVQRVLLYAPTDYTVLIRGETGVGKEVIAAALHDLSKRKKGPFVPVNCAAIPEQLMESMLFGHERGSFTGAAHARRGHFEEAHGGTIFLDEIGDMSFELQAKILRVLQDRVVSPLGSQKQIKVDVRILAATHQDLERMVREARFREDLYFRLRELEIRIPSLRERREDILMLADRFLREAARELGYERPPELRQETVDWLMHDSWRGNIRELRHAVRGAALRSGGAAIAVHHLDLAAVSRTAPTDAAALSSEVEAGGNGTWKERLEATERAALEETLRLANGNLTKAAELFGVPRTTYREKLVKCGLLKA
ncbi:MAG: sigma-54-dependent Fis family transcriptional regulator [Planctomycetota bacterium]